ncbi:MAG: ABC transporter ATP-binding protein [Verrucomicrobiota bacterium]
MKRWNLTGYQRFWYLFSTYARPYWKCFVLLFLLNLLIFVLGMLQTGFTGATITALTGSDMTGSADQLPAIRVMGINLNNMGTTVNGWLGITESTDKFKAVFLAGGLAFVSDLLIAIVTFFASWLGAYTSQSTGNLVQLSLFRHYMSFSIGFFNKNKAGQLISRMESDAGSSTGGYQSLINGFVVCPLMILFFFMITVQASWVLVAAVVVAGFTHHLLTMLISKPIQINTKKSLNISAGYRSTLMEAFTAIRVVKSFAAEDFEIARIKAGIQEMFKNRMWGSMLSNIQGQGRKVINGTVSLIILSFSAYELFVTKRINTSSCLFFVYICNKVVAPISQLSGTFINLQTLIGSSQRVYKYFKMMPDVPEGTKPIEQFHSEIEYQNVGFFYEKKPVLQNINLKIKKGETIALVGPSGAGKSTFVDMALRFYDPKEGSICIDGTDLRKFKQADYRRLFGVVSQESILFNATIRENIGYAREGITQEQIDIAAKVANAYDFIMDTPLGFDTYVGDRGIRLSGGQRQRIAIARAVVGNPQILIMDEATSSLDSESEREVQKAIKQVTQNMTAIIIAHRLSTVVHAHKIVVLEKGHVVDFGSHHELLERCDLYQSLYKHQFEIQESSTV